MWRKPAGTCVALAMTLAACGSGSHNSSPNAQQAPNGTRPGVSSTTNAAAQPTDAVALANSIGCKHPRKVRSTDGVDTGPRPLSRISCTLRDGATANIQTYTPSDLRQLKALVPTVGCSFAKTYGITELYAVYGDDFAASVNYAAAADTRAQAEALGKALGLPVTTVHCK